MLQNSQIWQEALYCPTNEISRTMKTKMEVKIASLPDRESLVAELWYDKVQWCEISQEEGCTLTLEIYPHPVGKPWAFKFEEALESLQQAKRKLASLDEPLPKQTPPGTEIKRSSFAKEVAQMAADPAIQAELCAIQAEFASTESDGLK